jgi:predicted nucleic acid-binding protein
VIVVDASAVVDTLVGAGHARERLATAPMVAPCLVDAEVGQTIRRMALTKRLEERAAERAIDGFVELEILRYPHAPLVRRAWDLRTNVTFSDALYVALAEMLNVPLVTLDNRLAGATGILATVEVIPTA